MPAKGRAPPGNGSKTRRIGKNGKVRVGAVDDFDTERFLTTVGIGRTIATYRRKSYIFRQGSKCDAVYYLQQGRIELSVVSSQGKERVVGLLGLGSFVGEGCLGGQPVYPASARASTEGVVIRFISYLLLRNSQIESDLVAEAEMRTVGAPISQQAMAARVGTTGSRSNYLMNKFRKLGLIEYNGHLNGHLKVHSSLLKVIVRNRRAVAPESDGTASRARTVRVRQRPRNRQLMA